MKHISKKLLFELVKVFALANTPKSLYRGILRSDVYRLLEDKCDFGELAACFNKLTARPNRSPLCSALAYAVLAAALRKNSEHLHIDANTMPWGSAISEYAAISANTIQIIHVSSHQRIDPKITTQQSSGSGFLIADSRTTSPQLQIIV